MMIKIATIAAAVLAAVVWWTADAEASCQGCPPGWECYIPEEGWNFGSCVPAVTPNPIPTPDPRPGLEQTCYCENDGRFRDEVKLYPCSCFKWPDDIWRWKGLGMEMPPPDARDPMQPTANEIIDLCTLFEGDLVGLEGCD